MHIILIETTSVRGFDIVKALAESGVEVTFVADDMGFFRGDLGFEHVSYATRVVEVPGLAEAWDLAERLEGRIGPNPVDGVICRVEDYLAVGSCLARSWGLPHDSLDATRLLADKDAVRARLAEHGLGSLRWRGVTTVADGMAAVEEIGLPAVVKPTFGGYSVGVTIAWTPEQAREGLRAILERPGADAPKAVVEEYAFGLNVSAEILVQDGEPMLLGFTEQRAQPPGVTAETGRHFPARFEDMGAAGAFALDVVRAVGIRNSAVHMELVVTPTGPELIEVNGRVAGHVVTQLMGLALGRSIFSDLVALATGERLKEVVAPLRTAALRHLWSDTAGTVRSVAVPAGLPGSLAWYELSVGAGSTVAPLTNNWDRIGYLVATGGSAADACATAEAAADAILAGVVLEAAAAEPGSPGEVADGGPVAPAGPGDSHGGHLLLLLDDAATATGEVTPERVLRAAGARTGQVSVVWTGTAEAGAAVRARWERQYLGWWEQAAGADDAAGLAREVHSRLPVSGVLAGGRSVAARAGLLQEEFTGRRSGAGARPAGEIPEGASGHLVVSLVGAGTVRRIGVVDRSGPDATGGETWVFPSVLPEAARHRLVRLAEQALTTAGGSAGADGVADGVVQAWFPTADSSAPVLAWGLPEPLRALLDAAHTRDLVSLLTADALGTRRPVPVRRPGHALLRRLNAPAGTAIGRVDAAVEAAYGFPEVRHVSTDGPAAPTRLSFVVTGADAGACRADALRVTRSLALEFEPAGRTHVLVLDRVLPDGWTRDDGLPLLPPDRFRLSVLGGGAGGPSTPADGPQPDVTMLADVFDAPLVERLAGAVHAHRPVHRVAAVPERLLETAARLRAGFGVPGDSAEYVRAFRDKAVMKQRAAAAGIRHAEGFVLLTAPALRAASGRYGAVVVKPRSAAGSRGVGILRTPAEVESWLAAEFVPGAYLCERFVGGEMCHVDAVVWDGSVTWDVSMYTRDTLSYTRGEPLSSATVRDAALRTAAEGLLGAVIDAWGVARAVLHLEAFWDGSELTFCEVAARPGGGGILEAFRATRGVNLDHAKLLIDVGEDPRGLRVDPVAAYAGFTVHYATPGVLTRYDDSAVAGRALHRSVRARTGERFAPRGYAGSGLSTHVFADASWSELRRLLAVAEQEILIEVEHR